MATRHGSTRQPPHGFLTLVGSERVPPRGAKRVGPADPNETISVIFSLRRRPDGAPVPDFDHFARTPLSQRRRLTAEEFAAKYGASPQDIAAVVQFATSSGLTVVETRADRRTLVVSGTADQMSKAFHVKLSQYQLASPKSRAQPGVSKGRMLRPPRRTTFRGFEGAVYLPQALSAIVIGVFGLDNRPVGTNGGTGDPPTTNPLTMAQVSQAYNFPSPGATIAQQTIGIIAPTAVGGYLQSDLNQYFNPLGYTLTPIPISVDGSKNVAPDGETTQDICIAGSAAPGANVAVYFSEDTEMGWVALIARAIHPDSGDFPAGVSPPTVLSASWAIATGDDPDGLSWSDTNFGTGVSAGVLPVMSASFMDAALQGITVCICTGDIGSNQYAGWLGPSIQGDGFAHVWYPASDPWVLAVGGTTLGKYMPSTGGLAWVEFVWNDVAANPNSGPTYPWGTGGGGVSDFFPVPSYQTTAGITPQSINPSITTNPAGNPITPSTPFNATGRGIPDVAGNASYQSGFSGIYVRGAPDIGNGTSASTPLWAGLIALINSNLGYPIGFINPILYALGAANAPVFNPINPLWPDPTLPQLATCPTDNSNNGIKGYPATAGWDMCTGWGSPNGNALLSALQTGLGQDCYFVIDSGIYAEQAVQAVITATGQATFHQAFFVVVDGFSANQLGITAASLSSPTVQPQFSPALPSGLQFNLDTVQPQDLSLLTTNPAAPQRFTYVYDVVFSSTAAFPNPSLTVTATVTVSSPSTITVTSGGVFQLIDQLGPYLAGGSGLSWLSNDVRVFQVQPGEWYVPGPAPTGTATGVTLGNTGNPTVDATTFIQNVIQTLNSGGGSFFDLISTDENVSFLDSLPTVGGTPVYNFAVARVRYSSATIPAQNVRAFFRLIPASTVSTAFDPTTTNRSATAGTEAIPLFGTQLSSSDPADPLGDVISIPCFAEPRVDASAVSTATQNDSWNVQTIPVTTGGATEVDVYFGCWLDINQSTPQFPLSLLGGGGSPIAGAPDGPFPSSVTLATINALLRGAHQCLVVEVAYDPDPIPVGASPSTNGPLAQRNLSIQPAANPGEVGSRRVPNTFTVRPTPVSLPPGARPDELMIDWGNVPAGSVASVFWPGLDAAEIVKTATRLFGAHNLTATGAHTLRMPVGGITYTPIPAGAGASIAGMISVDLPYGIREGQSFHMVIRQVTGTGRRAKPADGVRSAHLPARRHILGAFQLTIPVSTKARMLEPEERSLSAMRWIQKQIPAGDAWSPVMRRYVDQIAERVKGLGGNPKLIPPSQGGIVPLPKAGGGGGGKHPGATLEFTGKVTGLKYDSFGDFEGFLLRTEHGHEHRFHSREHAIEELVERAWTERIRLSVFVEAHEPHGPTSIILRNAPKPYRH
jgi:pro-kumamolisin-like protein/subtilase family protein